MRLKVTGAVAIVAIAFAAAASTVIGDEDPKARGEPVELEGEVVTGPAARAVGARVAARRGRRFGDLTMVRSINRVFVPADGISAKATLRCPRRTFSISGGYTTDGFIAADVFRPRGRRGWQFGFSDVSNTGLDGSARAFVMCIR